MMLYISRLLLKSLVSWGTTSSALIFSLFQNLLMVTVPLPTPSCFLFGTKKDWNRSRAWWQSHQKQFTGTQSGDQHLVEGTISELLTMPKVIQTHTPSWTIPSLHQVEYKTRRQSWLELTASLLTTGRCFISILNPSSINNKITHPQFNISARTEWWSIRLRTGNNAFSFSSVVSLTCHTGSMHK